MREIRERTDRILICKQSWPQFCISLYQFPKFWGYRYAPPCHKKKSACKVCNSLCLVNVQLCIYNCVQDIIHSNLHSSSGVFYDPGVCFSRWLDGRNLSFVAIFGVFTFAGWLDWWMVGWLVAIEIKVSPLDQTDLKINNSPVCASTFKVVEILRINCGTQLICSLWDQLHFHSTIH